MVDVIGALALLAVTAPLMAMAMVAVRLSSPGPVFFRQTRVGEKGSYFQLLKLRSMVMNAERRTGPVLSSHGDPRVTGVGRWLRATHFDELPQLVHVLTGEMSLVGPRPERPHFVRLFSDRLPGYTARLEARPGLTGLAQIHGCCSLTPEQKLNYDLDYLRNRSLLLDGKILMRTVWIVMCAGLASTRPVAAAGSEPATRVDAKNDSGPSWQDGPEGLRQSAT